jgi:hypothetical protein
MDYEAFTREKIARLRADADALERHLKEFLVASARASGVPARSRQQGSQEGSAIGAVLDAIDAAGPDGMTLDEMIDDARKGGFEVNRNTLRSQLFTAARNGRVVRLTPGRYASNQQGLALDPKDAFAGVVIEPDRYSDAEHEGQAAMGAEPILTIDADDEIPL